MTDNKLEIDVHAHWNQNPPIYRIFVDNEMLTERTFGYAGYQYFLTEHILCRLDTGVHTLKLESLDLNSRFELENFLVNKTQVNKNLLSKSENKIEWKFIIDNLLGQT